MTNRLNLTEDQIIEIFQAQREFNEFVVPEWKNMAEWDWNKQVSWIEKQAIAYSAELVELLDCTDWKWWKQKTEDTQNIHVELVDMLHFLVSIYQAGHKESKSLAIYSFMKDIDFNVHSHSDMNIYKAILKAFPDLNRLQTFNFLELTLGFLDLCDKFELGGQELYEKYFKKMQVNLDRQRQKEGYSDKTKNPEDCRHI